MQGTTIKDRRQDFPVLKREVNGKPLVYLDTSATAQKPQAVIDTVRSFYEESYATVNRAVYSLAAESTAQYQSVRENTARFLNASSPEEIIFTRGCTEAINFVAYSFGKAFIKPGDEILIPESEHHANIVPWQILCEDRGAKIRVIPISDVGEIDLDAYRSLLSERTKLVTLAHVSNSLGTIHPVKEIARLAHEAGAYVMVDGAQAAPMRLSDVQDLDADFYAFAGHKTYGPTGVGVLYGKRELLEQLPPAQGGGDMIDQVSFDGTTYGPLPSKFEAGTPMIAQVLGLGTALEYLMDIGHDALFSWESELLNAATERLSQIEGLRIIGTSQHKGPIISFVVEGVHHLDIGTMLDLKGVAIRTGHHCCQPAMRRFDLTGTCRASFGLYNNMDDVNALCESLEAVLKTLR